VQVAGTQQQEEEEEEDEAPLFDPYAPLDYADTRGLPVKPLQVRALRVRLWLRLSSEEAAPARQPALLPALSQPLQGLKLPALGVCRCASQSARPTNSSSSRSGLRHAAACWALD
jgi:hypothetical protein